MTICQLAWLLANLKPEWKTKLAVEFDIDNQVIARDVKHIMVSLS